MTEETHKDYVTKLGDDVMKDLKERITNAINKRPVLDEVTSEIVSHVTFCARKAASFYGRDALIDNAMSYYTGNQGRLNSARYKAGNQTETLYVMHGVSGSGKTSLMAVLASRARELFQGRRYSPVMVTRFCGTSGASSSARALMRSMCLQISRALPPKKDAKANSDKQRLDDKPVPTALKELAPYFTALLGRATAERPLIVHIDSLDQLSDEDQGRTRLDWLPYDLPPWVYITVSTLPEVRMFCVTVTNEVIGMYRHTSHAFHLNSITFCRPMKRVHIYTIMVSMTSIT